MGDQVRVLAGAALGAVIGASAGFLFFTARGRVVRSRIEPAIDDVRREFARVQQALDTLGELANDGLRMVHEFNVARAESAAGGRAH